MDDQSFLNTASVAAISAIIGFLANSVLKKATTRFRTDDECQRCREKQQTAIDTKIEKLQEGINALNIIVVEIAIQLGMSAKEIAGNLKKNG